ncbi:MAG TPA: class I fructose-bisphosphate aldolase [Acidimicrobiales bacterium]|jgi:fructose-bisphosphate aldolase class I|nr:class I fructose-bisphosphate aldolase [Acidimicrobiales bacterium]
MTNETLHANAAAMVAPGKGILAADESSGTITKRFAALGIPSTEELRRQYRETLLTAPGLENYISGVILYDETIRQATAEGTPFPEVLAGKGILPGIKVDTGAKPLAGHPGETITEGLDGLRERVAEYYELGARFAKWRAVITISATTPTRYAILANARALARYAALCQEGGLVPIVEPEVLMDGDHDLARSDAVTHQTLREVFYALGEASIDLQGMVLKPSMVISGSKGPGSSVQEVAEATVRCLRDCVPPSVPGIAFLSGGQSSVVATEHLDAMVKLGPHPWTLTFSYGRALQDDALRTWSGEATNREPAQEVLLLRSKCNSEAATGRYDRALETV